MSFQFSLNALRFEDVREEIIRYLTEKNKDVINGDTSLTGQFDYRGSNVAYIIDTMAYTTMLLSYMLANQANDIFLDTTTLRKNAVSIGKTLGYRPSRIKSSRIEGVFKYTSTIAFSPGSKITIPARTEFVGFEKKQNWISSEPIVLTYNENDPFTLSNSSNESAPPALMLQGSFRKFDTLGTGEPLQQFSIPSNKIDDENMRIYILPTGADQMTRREWVHAKTFFQIVNNEIFFVEEDITFEGTPKIIFGNGLIGAIPSITETIQVEYLETLGPLGNGETNLIIPDDLKISKSFDLFSFDLENLSFEPIADSFGGKDFESLTEIQQSAPRFFAAAGRAVTKNDFETVMLDQFNSIVDEFVVIGGDELKPGDRDYLGDAYIAGVPTGGKAAEEFLENENIYLAESQESNILSELRKIGVVATRKFFLKPSYIYVGVEPTVEIEQSRSSAERNDIIKRVEEQLIDYFDNELGKFEFTFRETKLRSVMDNVPGVVSSNTNLDYGFIISRNTFYIGKPTILFLPVRYLRDDNGNIEQDKLGNKLTTNFIKRNITLINEYNTGNNSDLELFKFYTDNNNDVTVLQETRSWSDGDNYWYPSLDDIYWTGSIKYNFEIMDQNGGQFIQVNLKRSDNPNAVAYESVRVSTTDVKAKYNILTSTDILNEFAAKFDDMDGYRAEVLNADTTDADTIRISRNHKFFIQTVDAQLNPPGEIIYDDYFGGTLTQVTFDGSINIDSTNIDHKWEIWLNETLTGEIYLQDTGTIDVETLNEDYLIDANLGSEYIGTNKNLSAGQDYSSVSAKRIFTRQHFGPEQLNGNIYGNSAISGKITNEEKTRWLYNSDLYEPVVINSFVSEFNNRKSFTYQPQSWKGIGGSTYSSLLQLVTTAINLDTTSANQNTENIYTLYFNSTNSSERAAVATLYWDTQSPNDVSQFRFEITAEQGKWLIDNGFEVTRIPNTNEILYEGFVITEPVPGVYKFAIPMFAEISTIKVWGKHEMMGFTLDSTGGFVVNDNDLAAFRDNNENLIKLSYEVINDKLFVAWNENPLFVVSEINGNLKFEAVIDNDDDFVTFNNLGFRSEVYLERYAFVTNNNDGTTKTENGWAVFCLDFFHRSTLGELEYNTGELQFVSEVSGFKNETEIVSIKIRDFFEKYDGETKMDILSIIPDNDYGLISGTQTIIGQLTDFDGVFTQTVRGIVSNINYTLI